MNLTGSQRHEIAKISNSFDSMIIEDPTLWNDTTGQIPEGSVTLTYRIVMQGYNDHVIIEPNGTLHRVR